jgi:hypothetical protein
VTVTARVPASRETTKTIKFVAAKENPNVRIFLTLD